MARFRNGMRIVEAEQQPSGDWLVWDGRQERLLGDDQFRARWEPADEEARRMWRGEGVKLAGRRQLQGKF